MEMSKMFSKRKKVHPLSYYAKEGLLDELKANVRGCDVNEIDENGLSALHYTARFDKVETARFLLSSGADINLPGRDQMTPLYSAAMYNCEDTFKLLLQSGADINLKNIHGSSVIHVASRRGNTGIVQFLLENTKVHVDVNILDNENWTPLHHACSRGHVEICKILIQYGALINAQNADVRSPLHLASFNGSAEIVKLLLNAAIDSNQRVSSYVNIEDDAMHTALHLASRSGHLKVCEMLIENGASMLENEKMSPLHYAAMGGHLKIIELLIAKGAEVNATDVEHNTPLHRAAMFNRIDAVKFLLENGANVNSRTDTNKTPFISAVASGHLEIAKYLVEKGANFKDCDIYSKSCIHYAVASGNVHILKSLLDLSAGQTLANHPDKNDQLPLHYAAKSGHSAILEELLKHTKNVAIKDVNEETALHLASQYGHYQCVEKLCYASPGSSNEPDGYGKTPLHQAVSSGRRKICKFLIDKGAEVHVKDDNRQTPLHCAAHHGFLKIVELLLDSGSQINSLDKNKNTALHVAANEGQSDTVNVLMDRQADVNIWNILGKSALDLAIDSSDRTATTFLQHARWKELMNVKDENDHTPLKKLISKFPEGAEIVMNNCIESSSHARSDPDYSITYNIGVLDPGPDDPAALKRKRFFGPKTMVKHKRDGLLRHPLTNVLLGYKWSKFGRIVYYVNFAMFFCFVALFSFFVSEKRSGEILLDADSTAGDVNFQDNVVQNTSVVGNIIPYVVLVFILFQILKEISQIITLRLKYFMQINNLLEWASYICAMAFMTPYYSYIIQGTAIGTQKLWIFGTFAIFLVYVNLSLFLQRFSWFGLYITMLIDVMKTVVKVLLVFSLFVFAFAFVFYILLKEQSPFASYPESIMKVLVMTIGEMDYSTIMIDALNQTNPGNGAPYVPYPSLTFFFMALFIVIMPISVINLLVGLAVGDIDTIQKNANIETVSMTVDYVSAIESNYPRFITRRLYKSEIVFKPNQLSAKPWWKRKLFSYYYGVDEKIWRQTLKERESKQDNEVINELSKQKFKIKDLATMVQHQQRFLEAITSHMNIKVSLDNSGNGKDEPSSEEDIKELLDSSQFLEDDFKLLEVIASSLLNRQVNVKELLGSSHFRRSNIFRGHCFSPFIPPVEEFQGASNLTRAL